MKNFLQTRLWVILMAMPIMVRAELIPSEHTYQSMNKATELIITNSYTTAQTALLWYKCSGTNAKFERYGGSIWSISLPKSNKFVTTSKVNELSGIRIVHYPASKVEDIKIYVSRDSVDWGVPLSGDNITYSSGGIDVSLPRNNYYVRIKNTSSTIDVYLPSIIWYQDHCNCFIYEAE